jgi:hypothetical protein
MRTPERPAAAERDVHAQTEACGLLSGEAERSDVLIGEPGRVVDADLGIIERLRVESGYLYAADAGRPHLLQFTGDLGTADGWAKPPPSHHDARIVWWVLEAGTEIADGLRWRFRRQQKEGRTEREERTGQQMHASSFRSLRASCTRGLQGRGAEAVSEVENLILPLQALSAPGIGNCAFNS